jgi:WD40 repeat protein
VPLQGTRLGHERRVQPDGTLLATGSKDTTAILWTVTIRGPGGAALEGIRAGHQPGFALGETLLATGSSDRTAILWDDQAPARGGAAQGDKITSVALSPDGGAATGSRDKTAILWM